MSRDDDATLVGYTAAYESLAGRQRREVTRVEYRCAPRRCLLLAVWQSPAGRFVYLPSVRHSPLRRTGQTAGEAGAEFAGQRRFPARTVAIDDPQLWLSRGEDGMTLWVDGDGILVACDHVRRWLARADVLTDVDAGTPGHPIARSIPAT